MRDVQSFVEAVDAGLSGDRPMRCMAGYEAATRLVGRCSEFRAEARWVEEHNAALAGGGQLSRPRIVFFSTVPGVEISGNGNGVDALVGGLREQGFEPGQNVSIDWRLSEGRTDVLSAIAADIVASRPDVIVTDAGPETVAAKEATSRIRIVFARGPADPVAAGLVQNVDQPEANVIGMRYLPADAEARHLELLQ